MKGESGSVCQKSQELSTKHKKKRKSAGEHFKEDQFLLQGFCVSLNQCFSASSVIISFQWIKTPLWLIIIVVHKARSNLCLWLTMVSHRLRGSLQWSGIVSTSRALIAQAENICVSVHFFLSKEKHTFYRLFVSFLFLYYSTSRYSFQNMSSVLLLYN